MGELFLIFVYLVFNLRFIVINPLHAELFFPFFFSITDYGFMCSVVNELRSTVAKKGPF